MKPGIDAQVHQQIESFPAMPNCATRALEILQAEDPAAEEIEEAVSMDPALTANVLRMANSSEIGQRGTVGSVQDAIVRLGTRRVAELAIAASMQSTLHCPVEGYEKPPQELWRHSIGVAAIARSLAKLVTGVNPGEAFTAGILHDLGKLVLSQFIGKESEELDAAERRGEDFDQAERDVLLIDHAEAGAEILKQWSLPEDIITAVRYHHRPDALETPNSLLDVVHVADALAMMMGLDEGREGLSYHFSDKVMERLQVDEDQLQAIALAAIEYVEEAAELF